jgi:farnesyl-diphosphate farnesyltransferase
MRIVDTVEDSPRIPVSDKKIICGSFHDALFVDPSLTELIDDEAYRNLVRHNSEVGELFDTIPEAHRQIIRECLMVCGNGMAEFLSVTKINTMEELDRYCHYVAGIVGIGMGKIFATYETENPTLDSPLSRIFSNHNGLLLQKTNIIRDFYEDLQYGKIYLPFSRDSYLFLSGEEGYVGKFIRSVLETHLPPTFTNLNLVTTTKIFRACAIPTTISVATLDLCYNNPLIFSPSKVKVSESVVERIVTRLYSIDDFRTLVFEFLDSLDQKLSSENSDSFIQRLKRRCE